MGAADEMRFVNVASLLDGITADTIRSARDRIGKIFNPDVGNKVRAESEESCPTPPVRRFSGPKGRQRWLWTVCDRY
jgi:hypothetical protein